ncbi:MAG: acetate--CoA ligase family protein [Candidatus Lokiarchaeia archaeon]
MKTDMNFETFFSPKSVAIIGASEKIRFGTFVTKNILSRTDMKGYPVHIHADKIMGVKAYKSVKDIPEVVDLAIFLIPSEAAPNAMRDCAEKGVKHVIILSAGFSEVDKVGERRQKEVVEIAKQNGMHVIGPNCVGVTNLSNRFTTAEIDINSLKEGNVAFIAQSGIFGTVIIDWAAANKFGLSKIITLGNKCDVDEIDMVNYLEKDEKTKVICLYLEGIKEGRGREFVETFKRVTRNKPILVLKSGRTEAGARAVKSHTGSLAGDDRIFDAVLKQTGAIRVDSVEELLDLAKVLANQPLPKSEGIAIITNSGSLAAMTSDELEKQGIKLAQFEPQTTEKMKKVAPYWTSIKNPVDIGPAMLQVGSQVLEAVLEDKNVGCLFIISSPPGMVVKPQGLGLDLVPFYKVYKRIMDKHPEKTIIVSSFGDHDIVRAAKEVFEKSGIPLINSVQSAARAIASLYRYKKYLEKSNKIRKVNHK